MGGTTRANHIQFTIGTGCLKKPEANAIANNFSVN